MKKLIEIDLKGDRKQDASWDGFGMALGSIFGRFWAQVGAKLAPKFKKMGYQIDVEKSSKNKSCKELQEK